jgi:hypothetical protein
MFMSGVALMLVPWVVGGLFDSVSTDLSEPAP